MSATVPYAGEPDGPTRRLELVLRKSPTLDLPATVAIDGHAREVEWGSVVFEIPADRTVRVDVWIELASKVGVSSYLLEAGMPAELEYLAPAAARYQGQLGPSGTVRRKGKVYLGCMVTFLFLALLPLIGLVVLLIASIIRG